MLEQTDFRIETNGVYQIATYTATANGAPGSEELTRVVVSPGIGESPLTFCERYLSVWVTPACSQASRWAS